MDKIHLITTVPSCHYFVRLIDRAAGEQQWDGPAPARTLVLTGWTGPGWALMRGLIPLSGPTEQLVLLCTRMSQA